MSDAGAKVAGGMDKKEAREFLKNTMGWSDAAITRFENESVEEARKKPCPNCGSKKTWSNSSGELQCDNCGYGDEEDEDE